MGSKVSFLWLKQRLSNSPLQHSFISPLSRSVPLLSLCVGWSYCDGRPVLPCLMKTILQPVSKLGSGCCNSSQARRQRCSTLLLFCTLKSKHSCSRSTFINKNDTINQSRDPDQINTSSGAWIMCSRHLYPPAITLAQGEGAGLLPWPFVFHINPWNKTFGEEIYTWCLNVQQSCVSVSIFTLTYQFSIKFFLGSFQC